MSAEQSAEKAQVERVRVVLADYAAGVRGAHSALLAIDAATMGDAPAIPAAKRTDYLLDGSPESVAAVREARGLPPIASQEEES